MSTTLADTLARDVPCAAIDLEMTGLDPVHDRICEIGVVGGDGDQATSAWSTLVRPDVRMSDEAFGIHGITPQELETAPPFAAVVEPLLSALDGRVVVGHGLDIDRKFLAAAWQRLGREWTEDAWIDTVVVARRALALSSHKLVDLCDALGVPKGRLHRALDDAHAAYGVWRAILQLLDPDGALTVRGVRELIDGLAPRSPFRAEQKLVLRGALSSRTCVNVAYLSQDDAGRLRRTEREIEIWKLAFPRIQGWCRLRNEERVFRLDRMLRVEPTDRSYAIPAFSARI